MTEDNEVGHNEVVAMEEEEEEEDKDDQFEDIYYGLKSNIIHIIHVYIIKKKYI